MVLVDVFFEVAFTKKRQFLHYKKRRKNEYCDNEITKN